MPCAKLFLIALLLNEGVTYFMHKKCEKSSIYREAETDMRNLQLTYC